MGSTAESTVTEKPKGRTIPLWLSGDALVALENLKRSDTKFREGTYCKDAVIQRLNREGLIQSDGAGEVAAKAFELAQVLGCETVSAKLTELAASVQAVPEAAR
ncbi:hypothetical protein [Oleiharenicola lentus]|uniref:hypothetical protein n=1 Tax=Oleiharenicola lentus TaxID=2508720 RepID=UPI003F667E3E